MTSSKRRAMLGIEFPPNVLDDLRLLSKKDRHSVSLLIRDAVDVYLDKRKGELQEMQEALRSADPAEADQIIKRLRPQAFVACDQKGARS